jgi:hypothetical protein
MTAGSLRRVLSADIAQGSTRLTPSGANSRTFRVATVAPRRDRAGRYQRIDRIRTDALRRGMGPSPSGLFGDSRIDIDNSSGELTLNGRHPGDQLRPAGWITDGLGAESDFVDRQRGDQRVGLRAHKSLNP